MAVLKDENLAHKMAALKDDMLVESLVDYSVHLPVGKKASAMVVRMVKTMVVQMVEDSVDE